MNKDPLPTSSLSKQLYRDKELEKLKALLFKEELFMDLTNIQVKEFLETAPIGTYLFRLSESSSMTIVFCFVGITGIRNAPWDIIRTETGLVFKWKDNEFSNLNDLAQNMKDEYIAKLDRDLEEDKGLTAKTLGIKRTQLKEDLEKIKTICSTFSDDSAITAMQKVTAIVTASQQVTAAIVNLEGHQRNSKILQDKIINKTILQSYMEWIMPEFLDDKTFSESDRISLEAYARVLENLYQHHKAEIKDNKIAGIPVEHIPCIIEAANLLKIDARHNMPDEMIDYIGEVIDRKIGRSVLLKMQATELLKRFPPPAPKEKEPVATKNNDTSCSLM